MSKRATYFIIGQQKNDSKEDEDDDKQKGENKPKDKPYKYEKRDTTTKVGKLDIIFSNNVVGIQFFFLSIIGILHCQLSHIIYRNHNVVKQMNFYSRGCNFRRKPRSYPSNNIIINYNNWIFLIRK